ncbi:hypothetical protein MAPG_03102 [Magnaporthiopsis poae ATCC 64411]|uniref:Uncharacterized protein n=1 Tax=Magnaporthiopsis poae (strain ATCC 64411 / 73-15) TaxID=644358 RepID=A0A0C4DT46_MAGP6|nr:hypothetical protein MAPG_03102 [Magnaporthiopsis poae ATCC 64411]
MVAMPGVKVVAVSVPNNDIGGAKSEDRDLINELECLQKALVHIERLHIYREHAAMEGAEGQDALRSGELYNLQGYLSGFVITLNTLIGEQGIEITQLASEAPTGGGPWRHQGSTRAVPEGNLQRLKPAADMQAALLEAIKTRSWAGKYRCRS